MKVIINGEVFHCSRAIKGSDFIVLTLTDGSTVELRGIRDMSGITIEGGEWEAPAPTRLDKVESQSTYTAMMTDTLIEEDEDDV